jgi:hypothetical protein
MIVLLGWGAMLLAAAVLQLVLGGEPVELALQAGVGLAAVAVGAGVAAARGRSTAPRPGERWRAADRSMATVLTAVGVALMAFGAEAGPWLVLIGAGGAAIGAAGLVREARAQRR